MVNFIIGRSGTGKSTLVCDRIVREIRNGERSVVLIVPEQQTVAWETRMAKLLPPSANFRLEITNFTRLSNSVFREYGGLADTVVDEGTRSLLIWRAMLSVWEQLEVYNHVASGREDRNIPHLMSAVDELKNSGVTPEMAEKALLELKKISDDRSKDGGEGGQNDGKSGENDGTKKNSGDLISRLSDAVLVYSAYNALLHEEYIDRGDLLDNLAKTLAKNPYFRGKVVFVDSFFSLTKAEERIVAQIMKQADEVTMTFACTPKDGGKSVSQMEQISMIENGTDDDAENGEIQFKEIERYLRTATSLAMRAGQEIKKIELREDLRHKDVPELALVERYLFDYGAEVSGDISEAIKQNKEQNEPEREPDAAKSAKNVQIIGCADVYDEAEMCASIVDKLVYEGYKYSEIAVVARNMKSREGVVDSVLRRHGVRYFLSETSDVANLPAVKFVLSALAVQSGVWQRKEMIALLKTGMTLVGKEINDSGVPNEMEESDKEISDGIGAEENIGINTALEGDVFEIYTETWNIRGRKAYTSGAWSMNPLGYKTERGDAAEEMLRLTNSAREKLVVPLVNFLSVFDNGPAEVREIAERIVYYAEDCKVGESLGEIAESYNKLGLHAEAEKALASWDKVCEILDRMVETLGDTKLDAGRFAGLFARVAASMDVGTIPTGVDEVVLGSSSGVRFDEVKCVIILGAVNGEFPGSVDDSGAFFGERDKLALESVGLNLGSPDLNERNAREYFMFYRTAAAAKERLYILSPSAESENLSEGALRVKQIFEAVGIDCTKNSGEKCIEDVIYKQEAAEYLLRKRNLPEDLAVLDRLCNGRKELGCENTITSVNERANDAQIMLLGNVQTDELQSQNEQKYEKKMGRMTLSQSKIETFVTCPFKYWCKYQMKLRPVPKAEIRTPDIGTFIHAVLERFFKHLPQDKLKDLPMSIEETEQIADEIIEDYVDELAASGLGNVDRSGRSYLDGRLSYLFLRLRRHVIVFLQALMQEFSQSEFRPVAFEMPIGLENGEKTPKDAPMDSVKPLIFKTESGAEIVLQGIADRIDLYEAENGQKFVRIVDYKTGSKQFSLDDVKRGLNVQLLIYLFSVWKYGVSIMNKYTEAIPAGAVYFQAKPSSISAEKEPEKQDAYSLVMEKIERTGVLLKDEEILRAMDSELSGTFVKTRLDSSGNLKEMSKSTSLLTLEEFGELSKELEEVIAKIGDRILSGEADAKPISIGGKNPCEWCENKFVCRNVQN